MYLSKEGHDFKWDACWNAVKGTSKWLNHLEVQRGKKKKSVSKRRSKIDLEDEHVDESPIDHGPTTPSTAGPRVLPTGRTHLELRQTILLVWTADRSQSNEEGSIPKFKRGRRRICRAF